MAGSTTVRIDEQTHDKLHELSCELGVSMQAILAEAVEIYRRQKFIEGANADYARVRGDPAAWTDLMEERRLLEGTLLDGLEDDQ